MVSGPKMPGIGRRARKYSSLLIALTAGCASFAPSEPGLPLAAVRFDAPSHFRAWFTRTEACSELRGSFEAIDWYVVPGVDSFLFEDQPRVGMWQRVEGRSQIVIAGNYLDHEMVVSHEILHHLLGREGHPASFFESGCALTWDAWGARQSVVAAR